MFCELLRPQLGAVLSRDFLKREREKEAFLSDNDGNGGETFDTTTDNT